MVVGRRRAVKAASTARFVGCKDVQAHRARIHSNFVAKLAEEKKDVSDGDQVLTVLRKAGSTRAPVVFHVSELVKVRGFRENRKRTGQASGALWHAGAVWGA